ncbi:MULTISPECIES: PilZ domain-containing protein [Shewanella]|uniref:PilZ domain-containing protein n=1 Tax=Shewanella TaxID=22 RepID=UPI0004914FE5|nr:MULTISPECIES: PilZ domain-containing protein [Shewanella]QLE85988.1 PilZ domain-containing protein [Shewanella sp. Scap07]
MVDSPNEHEERRQSLRVDMEAERIILNWDDNDGNNHTDEAICIDLARRGALIEYKQEFALGALLVVTFNAGSDKQNSIKGQVCRCIKCNDLGYHIAIQLI